MHFNWSSCKLTFLTYNGNKHELEYNYCPSAHNPLFCFYLKYTKVAEIGLCLRLQVEPTQLGSIDRASPYLRTPAPT
jgi:hypothetical protein